MDFCKNIYDGKLVRLASIEVDNDAPLESRWSHDSEYLRMLGVSPALPLSVSQVKQRYQAIEKEADEAKTLFYFAIRTQPGSGSPIRLVGNARLYRIEWTHGVAWVSLGIGDPADRRQGFASEALHLLAHYAFGELNLFRLTAAVPEYNLAALRLFEKAGFTREVCLRQALNRDGRTWNLLHLGLLNAEWKTREGG